MKVLASNNNSPDYYVTGRYENTKYSVSVYYAYDDTVYDIYIHEIHPYDDAEYAWAYAKDVEYAPKTINICMESNKIDTIQLNDYDLDQSGFESVEDFFRHIGYITMSYLKEYNEDIEPRMMHY